MYIAENKDDAATFKLLVVHCSGDMSEVVVSSGQYDGQCPWYRVERVVSVRSETDQWTERDDGCLLKNGKLDS